MYIFIKFVTDIMLPVIFTVVFYYKYSRDKKKIRKKNTMNLTNLPVSVPSEIRKWYEVKERMRLQVLIIIIPINNDGAHTTKESKKKKNSYAHSYQLRGKRIEAHSFYCGHPYSYIFRFVFTKYHLNTKYSITFSIPFNLPFIILFSLFRRGVHVQFPLHPFYDIYCDKNKKKRPKQNHPFII